MSEDEEDDKQFVVEEAAPPPPDAPEIDAVSSLHIGFLRRSLKSEALDSHLQRVFCYRGLHKNLTVKKNMVTRLICFSDDWW